MESLFVLLGLAVLALPVAVVWLLIDHVALRRRVQALEARLSTEAAPAPASADLLAPAAPEEESAEALHAPRPPEPPEAPEPEVPAPRPRRERASRLLAWLRNNWVYAISALSLVLAGVFLVQYGVENGLLPPGARVLATLALGAALIAGGEVVRRRFGDHEGASSAHLPSTFSGAGVVTLFVGVLSARLLYGLIGAEVALAGLVAVAAIAVTLGWFYGPFLAAVGITGAMVAPFVVGGDSASADGLYAYFVLITAVGLAVDAVRRWAWVSALSVGLGLVSIVLLYSGVGGEMPLIIAALAVPLAAIALPVLRLAPDHAGPGVAEWALSRGRPARPDFPVLLAAGTVAAASVILTLASALGGSAFWLSVAALLALFAALAVWARGAPALADLAALPAAGLGAVVWMQGAGTGPVWRAFQLVAEDELADFPLHVSWLLGAGVAVSLICVWRSLSGGSWAKVWAVGAALYAPVIAGLLEVAWQPAWVIGAYPWALHATALAIALTFLAERFSARDGEDRFRAAIAALGALSMMAFALMMVLSDAALTAALAVTVAAAAALDRRFDLPALGWFMQAGVAVIGYRLVADPGLVWGRNAAFGPLMLAYGGSVLAMAGARLMLPPRRPAAALVLESGALASLGILVSLLLYRWIAAVGDAEVFSHWSLALQALVWLGVGAAQLYRMRAGGPLARVRLALAMLAGGLGALLLGAAVTVGSPLMPYAAPVVGPPVFSSLTVAYLLPALALGIGAARAPGRWATAVRALAAAFGALWLGLTIRHFWQGADLSQPGMTQGELYSYTVALLLAGGATLQQAIARRSTVLRRVALGLIGVSIAKVFLIDISGLDGLTRVFSLLALGLALAGLAWLDRWAGGKGADDDADPD